MCVCVCVCVCARACVCVRARARVCVCVYTYIFQLKTEYGTLHERKKDISSTHITLENLPIYQRRVHSLKSLIKWKPNLSNGGECCGKLSDRVELFVSKGLLRFWWIITKYTERTLSGVGYRTFLKFVRYFSIIRIGKLQNVHGDMDRMLVTASSEIYNL